jgi:RNA 3'-terminal phosphate cyclase (ATP)
MATGVPVTLERVRAGRARPGLKRQHLTCVRAAAQVCGARVEGDEVGSGRVVFEPGEVTPGEYRFEIGTAGSTALVLQSVLPALMCAPGPSVVTITGGTFNPLAPPFPFLERAFAPALAAFGPGVALEHPAAGFYPAGGGELVARVTPVPRGEMTPAAFTERGELVEVELRAAVANLPRRIAEREVAVAREALGLAERDAEIVTLDGPGPGNAVWVVVTHTRMTEVFSAIGEKRKPAERVAEEVAREVSAYLDSGAAVGEHLADQLLIPMALAGGGEMVCTTPSLHTRTQAEIIEKFIEVEFSFEELAADRWRVVCEA